MAKKAKKTPIPSIRRSKPPDFSDMDEYEFQDMCCDLLNEEPKIAISNVYGPRGQRQHGIDVLALRRNSDGREVGQCKCYKVFQPVHFREASEEFFKYWKQKWSKESVKRFILFLACDIKSTKSQDAMLKEQKRFKKRKIHYEAWSSQTIRNKLRKHRAIVYSYLGKYWENEICGPLPQSVLPVSDNIQKVSVTVDSALVEKIETITISYSRVIETKLEEIRQEHRKGERTKVDNWISSTKNDMASWSSISSEVKAKILAFEAIIELSEKDNLQKAKQLFEEAVAICQSYSNPRLKALIKYKESGPSDALLIIENEKDIDSQNLKAGFLLELGRLEDAETVLENLSKGNNPNGQH